MKQRVKKQQHPGCNAMLPFFLRRFFLYVVFLTPRHASIRGFCISDKALAEVADTSAFLSRILLLAGYVPLHVCV